MSKYILLIFWAIIAIQSQAQEEKSKMTYGIETGVFLSHTGFNVNLNAKLNYQNNSFYLGPKFSLSDAYTLADAPWGINLGYRRNFQLANTKLTSFIGLDYNLTFSKVTRQIDRKNKTHETYLFYGLQFSISKRLSIINTIGYGVYLERFYDFREEQTNSFWGNNSLIQLRISYNFGQ